MAVLSSSSAATRSAAERISWYCSLFLAMLLVFACCDDFDESESNMWYHQKMQGHHCDEIYVVEEGETLHTISEKCGDPFIVEENPHIQDPDDVFPGLVIKITPNNIRKDLMVKTGGPPLLCLMHLYITQITIIIEALFG
ncbi:hypothetical protein MRB53_018184 [Persea americana]|uniref:Uncharacterized protein n=1 Tax=Persea americana TaxID=3435 RepID=A0ACC2M791_PERAE|nr:hypothetical protein MRB53_018184 [Persea americana]